MSVGSETGSVTRDLEQRGQQAGRDAFKRQTRRYAKRQDNWSRWARAVETSIRQQPITWALVCLGVGCAVGATLLLRGEEEEKSWWG